MVRGLHNFHLNLRDFIKISLDYETHLLLTAPTFDFKEDDEHQRISLWSFLQMWQATIWQETVPALTADSALLKKDKPGLR